jgi:sterol desaturase/sphingolipid hydroxylase (fatty acid hydroxylase superfamily)
VSIPDPSAFPPAANEHQGPRRAPNPTLAGDPLVCRAPERFVDSGRPIRQQGYQPTSWSRPMAHPNSTAAHPDAGCSVQRRKSTPEAFGLVRGKVGRFASSPLLLSLGFIWATLAIGASTGTESRDELFVTGSKEIDGLGAFLIAVYRSQDFQVLVGILFVGCCVEAIIPAIRQRASSRSFNIPYGFLMLLFDSAVAPLPIFLVDTIGNRLNWRSMLDLSFSTEGSIARSCAAVLISAAITDFFQYWVHRLQHGRLLWPQHTVHHSDPSLDVTTTQRAHFLDHLFLPIATTLPMALLFDLPANQIIVLSLLPYLWPYFIHANLRIGFGPAWWLLTSPQYHRIHHSIESKHSDRNFALWFPLWDVLFGTAYAPLPDEYPATGVPDVKISTIDEAFVYPVKRWYTMIGFDRRRQLQ